MSEQTQGALPADVEGLCQRLETLAAADFWPNDPSACLREAAGLLRSQTQQIATLDAARADEPTHYECRMGHRADRRPLDGRCPECRDEDTEPVPGMHAVVGEPARAEGPGEHRDERGKAVPPPLAEEPEMILLRDEIRRLAAQADEAKCGELRKQLEAAEARAKEAEAERDRLAENCRLASRALDQANEVVDGLRGEVAAQQETIRRYSELLQRAESFIVTRARWGQRNTEARELANKIQRTLRAEAVLKEHDA